MSTPADAAAAAVVQVKTSDGEIVKLPLEIAKQLKPIGDMIDGGGGAASTLMTISLPEVHSADLARAVEYCEKHRPHQLAGNGSDDDDVRSWGKELVGGLDSDGLYGLTTAASFLGLEGLLRLACQEVADRISGKGPEQIRAMFNIANDFSPEEEAAMRTEVPWALHD